jgi:hypothetical protein
MTKEDKKLRRTLVHALQNAARTRGLRESRLHMSPSQYKAAGKTLASKILSGHDPHTLVAMTEATKRNGQQHSHQSN